MPYESFDTSRHLQIRGLAQDRSSGAWRYVILVRRRLSPSPSPSPSVRKPQSQSQPQPQPQPRLPRPPAAEAPAYAIRRSLGDFKRLHDALAPLMGRALPKLPADYSLLSFLVGDTQAALLRKRAALERLLAAVDAHPAAADAPEYLEFLADTDAYAQASRGPPSPAASARSSLSCCSDDGVAGTPLGHAAALSSSASALRRAFFQQQRLVLRSQHESAPNLLAAGAARGAKGAAGGAAGGPRQTRRWSVDGGRNASGVDSVFEFSHFSMT